MFVISELLFIASLIVNKTPLSISLKTSRCRFRIEFVNTVFTLSGERNFNTLEDCVKMGRLYFPVQWRKIRIYFPVHLITRLLFFSLLYGMPAPSTERQHPEAWPARIYGHLSEGYLRINSHLIGKGWNVVSDFGVSDLVWKKFWKCTWK